MNYYAGIDLGGTFVKGGIVDEEGNILVKDKIPTGKERPYAEIAADMAQLVLDLAKKAGISPADVKAAALVRPAPSTAKTASSCTATISAGKGALGAELKKHPRIPVFATNRTRTRRRWARALPVRRKATQAACSSPSARAWAAASSSTTFCSKGTARREQRSGHMVIRMGGEKCTCGARAASRRMPPQRHLSARRGTPWRRIKRRNFGKSARTRRT